MLALMLTGCSHVHHVTPEQFKAELINMNTMYHCQYIGQADGKAYALRKRMPLIGHKWKEEILVTEAKDLGFFPLKPMDPEKINRPFP